MSTFQLPRPLMAYNDNPFCEDLGPLGLVLKSAVIPDIASGTPLNAVAAQGIITSDNTAPNNAGTVTIGTKMYTFKTALTEAKATGTLTAADVPHNNDTVAIGPTANKQTYTFKTTLTSASAANEILIEASASDTLDNLIAAINKAAGGGTKYGSDTTANSYVTASAGAGDTVVVTAKAIGVSYNDVLTDGDSGSGHLTWGAAHLTGGLDAVANEILINGADGSLTNLAAAINKTTGEGTAYSTGTVIHPLVSSSAVASHVLTITAKTKGAAGNSIVFTENATHITVDGSGTLGTTRSGVNGTVGTYGQMLHDGTYLYLCSADNTINDANWLRSSMAAF